MYVAPLVPVSWGELLDKITILQIKQVRMTDPVKLRHVRDELECLSGIAEQARVEDSPALERLINELRRVNETLWEIEDEIRECERCRDFGKKFVELARGVYTTNDRRAALKRELNELLGSELVEEKSYREY